MLPPREKARTRRLRVTPQYPYIEVKITGNRDPRGPDNSVHIWLDDDDKLHIMTWKANRCYQFSEVIETDDYIEVIQV